MIGVVSPGAMGTALAVALVASGHQVGWASAGRSEATRRRAERAGLTDLGTLAAVREHCEVVLSICPPADAISTARQFDGYPGLYVDANAISPATAAKIGAMVRRAGGRYVDGGVVGLPPEAAGTTRLYLSGVGADRVRALFAAGLFEVIVLGEGGDQASALKMSYAAWTKGSAALLLAAHQTATQLGVADALLQEWALSQPALPGQLIAARRAAVAKGWRWVAEMDEIATTFQDAAMPRSFGEGAKQVYARFPRVPSGDAATP